MKLPKTIPATSRAEQEPDRDVEGALLTQLHAKVNRDESATVFYNYNRVDLNGDGNPEVIGYVVGGSVCSTGGCSAFVIERTADGYRVLAPLPLITVPIYVANTSSHGWHDLIVSTADEGMNQSYRRLRFDGRNYSRHSGFARGITPTRPVDATPYLVGGNDKVFRLTNRK